MQKGLISRFFGLSVVFLTLSSAHSAVPTRLYLFGGGAKPKSALEGFFRDSKTHASRVLFITWATEYPAESCDSFREEAREHAAGIEIECSPDSVSSKRDPNAVIEKMRSASGIFFSGGDQSRIMEVFDSDVRFLRTLKDVFQKGTPVAGTSAGTAIQSHWMIERELIPGSENPNAVQLRSGVGLMRAGFVIDQHFLKRNRDKRLIAAMKKSGEPYGLGVDEGAAVLVLNSRRLLVFEGIARLYYRENGEFKYIDRTPSDCDLRCDIAI